ncbi:MAG: Hpt domain-containing protein [Pseudomonadota bacterium]
MQALKQQENDRPVDLVHLARQTMGDRELEREVLSLFVNQSRQHLRRLREAKSQSECKMMAHTIKGSARGLGAWQVASAAEAIEGRIPSRSELARLEGAMDEAAIYIGDLIN